MCFTLAIHRDPALLFFFKFSIYCSVWILPSMVETSCTLCWPFVGKRLLYSECVRGLLRPHYWEGLLRRDSQCMLSWVWPSQLLYRTFHFHSYRTSASGSPFWKEWDFPSACVYPVLLSQRHSCSWHCPQSWPSASSGIKPPVLPPVLYRDGHSAR